MDAGVSPPDLLRAVAGVVRERLDELQLAVVLQQVLALEIDVEVAVDQDEAVRLVPALDVGVVARPGLESLENLRQNLQEQGYDLDKLPYVVQYNKRDLPNAIPMAELEEALNPTKVPSFEAVAPKGIGVFDTLKAVAKLVLTELRKGG